MFKVLKGEEVFAESDKPTTVGGEWVFLYSMPGTQWRINHRNCL
jgi:hypothetical protein